MASGRRTDEQDRSGCSRMLFGTNLTGLVREPRHRRSQLGQAGFSLPRTCRTQTAPSGANPGSNSDWRSVKGRAARLGMKVRIGCHTFRATGITAYLEAVGTLENAQAMAAHESPRTTKLYDRTGNEITLD
jgi:integrase